MLRTQAPDATLARPSSAPSLAKSSLSFGIQTYWAPRQKPGIYFLIAFTHDQRSPARMQTATYEYI